MSGNNFIYLDNNATTKVHEEVINAITHTMKEYWANPSSIHKSGKEVRQLIENSREIIAKTINAKSHEIYFTSGGTEANNLAIKGVALYYQTKGKHIITSKIEHPCVLESIKYLEKQGFEITYLENDTNGIIDLDHLKKSIRKDTILVSVMLANNEIGTIEPIKELVEITKSTNSNTKIHTDAVQALGKIPVDVNDLKIDLLSVSAHKIYGPKGIGALYIRENTKITPLFHGGHQEHMIRPGTENYPAIIGFAKACELIPQNIQKIEQIERMRDYFEEKVLNSIKHITINAKNTKRVPNTSNISFHFIEGEALALALSLDNIFVSTGSACASGSLDPSHVLLAIKVPVEHAQGTLRFSFGIYNNLNEVDIVIDSLKRNVKKLRELSPLWEDFITTV